MAKDKAKILKEKKDTKRTFKENSSLGKLQDRVTELELIVEELQNGS